MFVHTAGTTYTMIDGVRRAKAALMAGHETIRAVILDTDGSRLDECDIPLEALWSIRDAIPRISRADEVRWSRASGGAQAFPLPFPPVIVELGGRGQPVSSLDFDFGDSP